jgi:multiple sugar transport system substrate-binding protein
MISRASGNAQASATNDPSQDRRQFLASATGAALASAMPTALAADGDTDFHVEVASRAKALAGGSTQGLRILIPAGCEANLAPVVARFKELTGIVVALESVAVDEINTRLTLDTLGGTGTYDLALPATFGLPDLVASGAITSLSSFAQKHEPAGFRDEILYSIGDSFDNELYGFQADGDAYTMFYLRDLLESPDEQARYADTYGEALGIPRTWAELDRQMAWFHRPDENIAGGLLFRTPGYLAWEWWVRFHAKGYWPLSETLTPQIHSDAGVAALEELIRATEYLAPNVSSLGLTENWERFSRGNVYCNIGWGGTQKFLNKPGSAVRDRLTYGPTPGGIIDGELLLTPYFNWGWNYVVTSISEQPELAYLFALFASTPTMSTIAVAQADGFFDPFRPEHYTDEQITDIYSAEFLKVHELSLKTAIPDLYLANQSNYFNALSEGLAKSLNKTSSPEEALRGVAQKWDLISSRLDVVKQQERWKELRAKYPANVRRLLKDVT